MWTADEEMAPFPAAVQSRLSLPASSSVLDLGCGSGRDVAAFARWFAKVVGIALYAHDAWENVTARYPFVHFHAVDFLDFEVEDCFELIFDNGCFHHEHPARTQQYLHRVTERLTPSGHYVLSTFKNPAGHSSRRRKLSPTSLLRGRRTAPRATRRAPGADQ